MQRIKVACLQVHQARVHRQDFSFKQLAFLIFLALSCDTAHKICGGAKILRDRHSVSLCFPKYFEPFWCNISNSTKPNEVCNPGNCAVSVRNRYSRLGSLQIDTICYAKYKAGQNIRVLFHQLKLLISYMQRKHHSACSNSHRVFVVLPTKSAQFYTPFF